MELEYVDCTGLIMLPVMCVHCCADQCTFVLTGNCMQLCSCYESMVILTTDQCVIPIQRKPMMSFFSY